MELCVVGSSAADPPDRCLRFELCEPLPGCLFCNCIIITSTINLTHHFTSLFPHAPFVHEQQANLFSRQLHLQPNKGRFKFTEEEQMYWTILWHVHSTMNNAGLRGLEEVVTIGNGMGLFQIVATRLGDDGDPLPAYLCPPSSHLTAQPVEFPKRTCSYLNQSDFPRFVVEKRRLASFEQVSLDPRAHVAYGLRRTQDRGSTSCS
ncbi:hypothetical protein KIN20_028988 [Parelaphostrongylus tenuis]|uniref:Uncharacterized protein n=1 Tax=Parelaphostrongylus tenuis TaxID=148309 RepID=A0AAD5R1U0_PARTN|nr:hypothetical protein KIN20_028988 [Parelaphostrongylus tenuis]